MTARKAFEEWAGLRKIDLITLTLPPYEKVYAGQQARTHWIAWQESRKQALAEAADLASQHEYGPGGAEAIYTLSRGQQS